MTSSQHRARGFSTCQGLTLVELLTVVAVISVLAALLLATLPGAKERARRAACRSNLRQFVLGLQLYGAENADKLLTAQMPALGQTAPQWIEEYSPVVSPQALWNLVHYGGAEAILRCPGLGPPYDSNGIWHHDSWYQVLGYNYLGGHRGTPWPSSSSRQEQWTSPQNFTEPGRSAVLTELNMWSQVERVTFAPHGTRGRLQRMRQLGVVGDTDPAPSSAEIGAAGGHVAFLDGAVVWRPINQMRERVGASHGAQELCLALW